MSGTAKKGVRAYDILEKILYRKGNKKAHVYSADHENTCFLLVFSNREDRFLSNEVSLHSGDRCSPRSSNHNILEKSKPSIFVL